MFSYCLSCGSVMFLLSPHSCLLHLHKIIIYLPSSIIHAKYRQVFFLMQQLLAYPYKLNFSIQLGLVLLAINKSLFNKLACRGVVWKSTSIWYLRDSLLNYASASQIFLPLPSSLLVLFYRSKSGLQWLNMKNNSSVGLD